MSFSAKSWPNFVAWLEGFAPYREEKEKLLRYFGNERNPPTGFRSRSLELYNAISNRQNFNCGYRFVINVYSSCAHGCRYCYVNGYSGGVGKAKRKSGLIKRLRRDIADLKSLDLPRGPVHISNSTDPLQEIENRHGDTYTVLEILAKNRDRFSEIILLTKNPKQLLRTPGDGSLFGEASYVDLLFRMKDILTIEISIAFYRDDYRHYEPNAPHPRERLDAMRQLIEHGFNVWLRLDPIFPRAIRAQSRDDLDRLLDAARGIQCVISKPLRLVKPRKNQDRSFFHELFEPHYSGGKRSGVEWHGTRYVFVGARAQAEMAPLAEACTERGLPLVHCKETVLVDAEGVPVIRRRLGSGDPRRELPCSLTTDVSGGRSTP
jgi:DNA repair photolyase